jgi:hypothetical protein
VFFANRGNPEHEKMPIFCFATSILTGYYILVWIEVARLNQVVAVFELREKKSCLKHDDDFCCCVLLCFCGGLLGIRSHSLMDDMFDVD